MIRNYQEALSLTSASLCTDSLSLARELADPRGSGSVLLCFPGHLGSKSLGLGFGQGLTLSPTFPLKRD